MSKFQLTTDHCLFFNMHQLGQSWHRFYIWLNPSSKAFAPGDEFCQALSSWNRKSCKLDPPPPFLIINVSDSCLIFGLHVQQVSWSVTEGHLPWSKQWAIVSLTLQNPTLTRMSVKIIAHFCFTLNSVGACPSQSKVIISQKLPSWHFLTFLRLSIW